MTHIVITPPEVEPITLAEARTQCNAGSEADAVLKVAIAGARAACEGKLNKALIHRTLEHRCATLDPAGIRLPLLPVASIVSVHYDDAAGQEQALDGSQYRLTGDGDLVPARGATWPVTYGDFESVRIQYVAGYGNSPASVPADVRSWLLLTVAYLHAQREAFDGTGKVVDIPNRFVDGLLDPHRSYRL